MQNKFSSLKTNLIVFNKINIKSLPENPGIYAFVDKNKYVLYIGKAKNLKRRISSYNLATLLNKTKTLIAETTYFTILEVTSELESLLLEAQLVRKFKPKYNIQLKDDKNPIYIHFTNEYFPRILTVRKRDIKSLNRNYFGPFPNSSAVKTVLKLLRKIFPYSQHKIGKKACIYNQIGLCNPCPNIVDKITDYDNKLEKSLEYKKNINLIKNVFSGKITSVRKKLKKEMLDLSDAKKYEKALIIRGKIEKLDYITQSITPIDGFLKNPNLASDIKAEEIKELYEFITVHINISSKLSRIECYDISHISGNFPTASMVTFINGEPDKNFYRHFKIRQKNGADDVASLTEVAKRRVKYLSIWGAPDLIIVDGGKAQSNAFHSIFGSLNIPVVGIAKSTDSLIIPKMVEGKIKLLQLKMSPSPGLRLIQRIRDESHRFARRYHHKLIKNYLIP